MEEFQGTFEVDADPSGKRFQGAWLRPDHGERLLVDYRPRWWKAFAGLRVAVKGKSWEPEPDQQAMMAQHFRVEELDVVEGNEGSPEFVGVRAELSLAGRFVLMKGEEDSKREGETWLVFCEREGSAEGRVWGLANPSDVHVDPEKDVLVQAREMLRSPFWAHSDPRTLWVLGVA